MRTGVTLLWAKTGVLTANAAPPKLSVATQTASGKRTPIGADAPWFRNSRENVGKREGTTINNDQFQMGVQSSQFQPLACTR
jgi:hypothetical protein